MLVGRVVLGCAVAAMVAAPAAAQPIVNGGIRVVVREQLARGEAGIFLAEDACGRVLAASGVGADDWNLCGVVAARAGRLDLARSRFERAVATDPRHREAWLNVGASMLELREWERALDAYGRARALADDANAWVGSARALGGAGRAAEAEAAYARALALAPEHAAAHYELGMLILLRTTGDLAAWRRARPHLDRFLALTRDRPEHREAVERLTRRCTRRRRAPNGARVCREGLLRGPLAGEVLRRLQDEMELESAREMQREAERIERQAEDRERQRLQQEHSRD